MNSIQASDLILNKDGSVYHLSLKPKDISDVIFTVGDPGRVHRVSSLFDSIDFEMNKREFITHTGKINGKRVTVMSTGMGVSNIEILMTELDLLANFDFKKNKFKNKKKKLKIIRLGTSGSIQSGLPVGSLVISEKALGLDNMMDFYPLEEDKDESEISDSFNKTINLKTKVYCKSADSELLTLFSGDPFINGLTLTCPGFYAPQGRFFKVDAIDPKYLDKITYYNSGKNWITNIEMETASYYAFGALLGHQTISLNAILANRISGRFSKNPYRIVDRMIKIALQRMLN